MRARVLTIALSALALLLAFAGPAAATHTHGKVLPNGACVLLAADSGEQHVHLPHADEFQDHRQHPLHVNVHLGVPGTQARPGTIFVALDDLGNLTPDAVTRCGGEFLND